MAAQLSPRGNFSGHLVDVDRKTPFRQIGFGRVPGVNQVEKKERFIAGVKKNLSCQSINMPNIDSVTVLWDGPLTPAEVKASFGTTVNILGASQENPPAGASQVYTTFADPGKFQMFALICAIQWRFDVDPIMWTAKGNAYTTPPTSVPKPVSSDIFASAVSGGSAGGDFGASAALGVGPGTLTPAYLEWAWWAEMAMFYMSRGYNLQWQYGHNCNLMDDSLYNTAYLPSNAQEGSASSSEIDISLFVNRVNQYYVGSLSSTAIFLMIDRIRAGNSTLGGIAGQSVFHPSRAFETVGGTYGGSGLQSMLRNNSAFRRLSTPFLAWPGVALGLKAQEQSNDDGANMRRYFDATCGFGGVAPATFTEYSNIANGNTIAGTAGQTGVELSLDASAALNESIQLPAQRTTFKGGPFRITNAFKGWELCIGQAELLRDPDVRDALQNGCGCQVGWQG